MGIKDYNGVRYSHAFPSKEYKEFRRYSKDWEKTYFDKRTGGFVVTHKERVASGNASPNEKEKFLIEQDMAVDLAKMGHKIEHLSDKNRRPKNTYDVTFNGERAEFKNCTHNNEKRYIRKAIKEQGARVVVVRFKENTNKKKAIEELRSAKNQYRRKILYYYQSEGILREI